MQKLEVSEFAQGFRSSNNVNNISLLCIVVALGVIARILVSLRGHNFDIDSWVLVSNIAASGGNVYAETPRYNYGPIWFNILSIFHSLPFGQIEIFGESLFRIEISFFLTIIDLLIFSFLSKLHGLKVGALFFLNPISIIITGYHSQFDNLAILLGLISLFWYDPKKPLSKNIIGLVVLGLSLSAKHILFAFPIWIAFKETTWRRKLTTMLIPYCIFLASFLPYLTQGRSGIIQNVFLYRSQANAPFWSMSIPTLIYNIIPLVILFMATLIIMGLVFRKKSPLYSFYIYLICLVLFSSAVANQYLSIPTPSIAVFWNWGYGLYTMFGTLYLAAEGNGLHFRLFGDFGGWKAAYGYHVLIIFLGLGLYLTIKGKDGLTYLITRLSYLISGVIQEISQQLRAPWK